VTVAAFAPVTASPAVSAGQSTVINLTAYQATGSNLSFALTCLGLPSKSSCQFSNSSFTPGPPPNGSTVQLTFLTSSSGLPTRPSSRGPRPWGTLGLFAALVAMLMVGISKSGLARQRRLAFIACLSVVFLAAVITGCGANSVTEYTGTPKGTTTFTVEGTSGATMISTQVTVTVQ
jgi:hypothetical protein